MTGVEKKKKALMLRKNQRKREKTTIIETLFRKPLNILQNIAVITTLSGIILLTTFSIGVFAGSTQHHIVEGEGFLDMHEIENESLETRNIDGYNIYLMSSSHEMMENRLGYTLSNDNTTIAVQADRDIESIYSTCVHEKMHNLGIGSSNHQHDWISSNQDAIVDDTCLKFIYSLEPNYEYYEGYLE